MQDVISRGVFDAIQIEASRAHAKHGDRSMLGEVYSHADRLAILAEEGGEVSDEALALMTGLLSGALMRSLGRIGHELTYDQELAQTGSEEKLWKELTQAGAMVATWMELLYRRLLHTRHRT